MALIVSALIFCFQRRVRREVVDIVHGGDGIFALSNPLQFKISAVEEVDMAENIEAISTLQAARKTLVEERRALSIAMALGVQTASY